MSNQRTMEVLVETRTSDNLPIIGLVVVDGKKKDCYYVSVQDESNDMETVVHWKKETSAGRFETPYRVVVAGVGRAAVSCNCEWSKKGNGSKPCRHRAGTEKLIQLGKM